MSKLNVTHHDGKLPGEDNHLLILDKHLADLIKHFTQQQKESTEAPQHLNAVCNPISGAYLEHRELPKTPEKESWTDSFANKLGQLSQGHKKNGIAGANTIFFTP